MPALNTTISHPTSSLTIPTQAPVLVTGASGYVAGWIVQRLVQAGVMVHAAVRNPKDAAKLAHLQAMSDAGPGRVKFFAADLLQPGSYAEAMAGCEVVFHTASPFTTSVKDPQRELIDPALLGTRNVLEEATRTPSVKRVVLTSSCAAIYSDAADCAAAPGGVLTEAVWNTTASLEHQPYSYSKTLAEREGWRLAEAQTQWTLVVVNPSLVIGPGIYPRPTSESFNIVRQLGDGTMKMGAPRAGFGVVDVRDLAQAHLAAAFTPGAEGRHIVSGHNTDLLALGQSLLPILWRALSAAAPRAAEMAGLAGGPHVGPDAQVCLAQRRPRLARRQQQEPAGPGRELPAAGRVHERHVCPDDRGRLLQEGRGEVRPPRGRHAIRRWRAPRYRQRPGPSAAAALRAGRGPCRG